MAWDGRLTLTPGVVVYAGPGGEAARHSHHAIQLIRSFDEPFELEIEGATVTSEAALVPGNRPHAFRHEGSRLLIALIEPLGPRGTGLAEVAGEPGGFQIGDRLSAVEPDRLDTPLELVRSTFDDLLPARPSHPMLSPHVLSALAYLDEAIEEKPGLEAAAAHAGISPSRLTHLFTEQIGIPFRKFVLWLRLRRVVDLVSEGANLTEAAHGAGFSDSAHLSKVFRTNFGQSPSFLLGMEVANDSWPA